MNKIKIIIKSTLKLGKTPMSKGGFMERFKNGSGRGAGANPNLCSVPSELSPSPWNSSERWDETIH